MKLPDLLSVDEVAAAINRHPEVVRRQARDGRLPAEKIGRVWFFRPERLVEAGYSQFFPTRLMSRGNHATSTINPMLAAIADAGLHAIRNPERAAIFQAVGDRLAQVELSTYVFECTPDGLGVVEAYRQALGSNQELAELTGVHAMGRFLPFERVPHIQEVSTSLKPRYVGDPDELVARVAMAALPGKAVNARRVSQLLRMESAILAPLIVRDRAIGVITVMGTALKETDLPAVMAFANQTAAALENARLLAEAREIEEAAVLTMASAIELRDALHSRAPGHAELAERFGRHLGFDPARLRRIRYAALLQDLGKLTLPDAVIKKRGQLDAEERALLMTHPVVAADLLLRMRPLAELSPIVRAHHEWFNGEGYPDGLRGEVIPLETRVVAIVNAFYNVTFERPSKTESTIEEGLEEIARFAGVTLDPALTEAFIEMWRQGTASRAPWFLKLSQELARSLPTPRAAGRKDILSVADSRELRIIYRIAQETTAVLDLGTLLTRIVKIIRDVMGYYLVSIVLPQEKAGELRIGAHSGYDRDITGLVIPVERGITGWVFRHGTPVVVGDVRQDERYFGLTDRVQSEVAFPLISRGHVVGVLNAESEQLDAFSDADTALLSAVGSQIASIIEVAQLHDTLKREANNDPLTRLFNRRRFLERAQQEAVRAESAGETFSLLFLDVDDLKLINDSYGHLAGDALLREVANAIMDAVRGEDTVARYGGDEFVVLLPATNATAAATVAQRVTDGIARHRFMAGRELVAIPGVSLGIATFPHDGRTIDQLLSVADATLYREKRRAS